MVVGRLATPRIVLTNLESPSECIRNMIYHAEGKNRGKTSIANKSVILIISAAISICNQRPVGEPGKANIQKQVE